jgi:hypothetical protein
MKVLTDVPNTLRKEGKHQHRIRFLAQRLSAQM